MAEVVYMKDMAKVLENLSAKVRNKILRKAMREATKPTVQLLAVAWLRHPYHRKGNTGARIGNSQRATFRTEDGSVICKIGTNYKYDKKSKLWHILEHGWKHYAPGSGSRAYGRKASRDVREYREKRRVFMQDAWKQMRSQGLSRYRARDAYGAIGKEFDSRHPGMATKSNAQWAVHSRAVSEARSLPMVANRFIPGEHVSSRIAKGEIDILPDRVANLIQKELQRAKLA
jgi:hypothetical protein